MDMRLALDPATRLRAAENAVQFAMPLLDKRQEPIALYWPVRNELSPLILAEHLVAGSLSLCLPVVVEPGAPLCFRSWAPGDPLHKGRYGIDEPSQKAEFVVPGALLLPLIAFDRAGTRLGTGGGYYDRTLERLRAQNPEIKAYGFSYASQEVPYLPVEPHDQKLDGVVTEKEVVLLD